MSRLNLFFVAWGMGTLEHSVPLKVLFSRHWSTHPPAQLPHRSQQVCGPAPNPPLVLTAHTSCCLDPDLCSSTPCLWVHVSLCLAPSLPLDSAPLTAHQGFPDFAPLLVSIPLNCNHLFPHFEYHLWHSAHVVLIFVLPIVNK